MAIGNMINKIRKFKNIPVKHLITNCMSRSTYNYFTEGKSDISVNKFLTLIDRLNISLEEFEYIKNGYNNKLFINFNKQIQPLLFSLNVDGLKHMRFQIYSKAKCYGKLNEYNKYYILYCLTNIYIEKFSHSKILYKYKQFIKNYLLDRYSWTYYELSLFNISLPIFNINMINIFMPRVLQNLNKYKNLIDNENECVRILANIAIIYINNKNTKKAISIINLLRKYKLNDNMIIEKICIKYLTGIILIINNKNIGFTLIKDVFTISRLTNPKTYYIAIKNNYHQILKIYKIKNQLSNNI